MAQSPSSFSTLLKEAENVTEISTFDPKEHTIIPLSLFGSNDGLETLKEQFERKGWCIIDLGPNQEEKPETQLDVMFPVYHSCFPLNQNEIQDLISFFSLQKEEKEKYSLPDLYGYSSVDHKESVHILTTYYMMRDAKYVINEVLHPKLHFLQPHNKFMDRFTMDFIDRMSKMLGVGVGTVSHLADMPIAFKKHTNMLDIAWYNNKTSGSKVSMGDNTDEVNCVPHYDPGLFSLSILSTNEGLQLYDPVKNTWFAGPVNTVEGQERYGVLWLGNAAVKASEGKFKAGVHRVVYPRQENLQPRLTMWYEACTVEQINGALNSDTKEEVAGVVQISNIPKNRIMVGRGESKSGVAHRIERHFGLPMSKMMMRSDKYSSYYSQAKPKKPEEL